MLLQGLVRAVKFLAAIETIVMHLGAMRAADAAEQGGGNFYFDYTRWFYERLLFTNNFLAERDTFVTHIDSAWSRDQASYLLLLFAAERAAILNALLPALFIF